MKIIKWVPAVLYTVHLFSMDNSKKHLSMGLHALKKETIEYKTSAKETFSLVKQDNRLEMSTKNFTLYSTQFPPTLSIHFKQSYAYTYNKTKPFTCTAQNKQYLLMLEKIETIIKYAHEINTDTHCKLPFKYYSVDRQYIKDLEEFIE